MDVNKEISDFLRDSQYKLALMTAEMDSLEDDGDVYYESLKERRWELDYFYSILLETTMAMDGAFNWLAAAEWKDKDILNEIHHLRNKYELNGLPVLDYESSITTIVTFVNEGSGAIVPNPIGIGDVLIGGLNGWELGSFNKFAGMLNTQSLSNYFIGRT